MAWPSLTLEGMTSDASPTVVWFRDDLRLADNPALTAAAARGPVVALFVLDEESPGIRPLGGAARWWLHHSLASLQARLAAHGVPLVLRRGAADGGKKQPCACGRTQTA